MLHRHYMYKTLSPTYQSNMTTLPSQCPFPIFFTHQQGHSQCQCKNCSSLSLTFLSLLLSLKLPPTNLTAPTRTKTRLSSAPHPHSYLSTLPHCQTHHYSNQPMQSFTIVSKPLACNPSSYSHQPKALKERYQHQWVQFSVGGLLGVLWDSKDQETSYTVAPCWAPCGWYRAHFFHYSYKDYDYCIMQYKKWEFVMDFALTSIYQSYCCYPKLLCCVTLWLDGWFCLPNAPDIMVIVLQCVFTLWQSVGPTTITDWNETIRNINKLNDRQPFIPLQLSRFAGLPKSDISICSFSASFCFPWII